MIYHPACREGGGGILKSTGYVSDGGTYNVSVGVEGGSGSSSLSRNIEGGRHAKTTPSSPGRTDGDAEVEEGEGGGSF